MDPLQSTFKRRLRVRDSRRQFASKVTKYRPLDQMQEEERKKEKWSVRNSHLEFGTVKLFFVYTHSHKGSKN
jgi:hypothetical protein